MVPAPPWKFSRLFARYLLACDRLERLAPVKVLIAIDSSDVSGRAVAFAGNMLAGRTGKLEVTLFHVVESIPEFVIAGAKTPVIASTLREAAKEWGETNRQIGERLLKEQQEALVRAGVAPQLVRVKVCHKESRPESARVVAALAIIEEMQQGYDVVVIGRRGASSSIPTILGSVAEKVARESHGRTLWIVD